MKRKHYTNKNATNRNPAVAFFSAKSSTWNQATSAICILIFFMAFFSS